MVKPSRMKPPKVAVWKVLSVLVAVVLLTPVWIVYGLLGAILTRPSSTIARSGLQLLSGLGVWSFLQIAWGSETSCTIQLQLGAWVLSLLLAQWKLDQLLVFHVRQKPEERRIGIAGFVTLFTFTSAAMLLRTSSLRDFLSWQSLSPYPKHIFWTIYTILPLAITISEARLWIPARYSELQRLEHEIIGRNVNVPFHAMKVAGLGTVHVPCTASASEEMKPPLVLLHGYAAGNALWACNFEELSKHYDVYAVEWLGTGKSDRPKFTSYEWGYVNGVMVEALEKWRKELKESWIEKFYLGGHSMGAMFATSYTVKYPGRIKHLVLISPAGVGHPPASKGLPLGLRIFRSTWNFQLTPMSVVRYAGPLGPRFLRFITSLRVSVMPEASCIRRGLIPVEMLAAYWYNNWALETSGEIAMHSHLLPGVYAKRPLCEMLTPENVHAPITFIYGGGPDWMSSSHGEKVAKTFDGKQSVEVVLVPEAGHQLFMDNAAEFNKMLLAALGRNVAT